MGEVVLSCTLASVRLMCSVLSAAGGTYCATCRLHPGTTWCICFLLMKLSHWKPWLICERLFLYFRHHLSFYRHKYIHGRAHWSYLGQMFLSRYMHAEVKAFLHINACIVFYRRSLTSTSQLSIFCCLTDTMVWRVSFCHHINCA